MHISSLAVPPTASGAMGKRRLRLCRFFWKRPARNTGRFCPWPPPVFGDSPYSDWILGPFAWQLPYLIDTWITLAWRTALPDQKRNLLRLLGRRPPPRWTMARMLFRRPKRSCCAWHSRPWGLGAGQGTGWPRLPRDGKNASWLEDYALFTAAKRISACCHLDRIWEDTDAPAPYFAPTAAALDPLCRSDDAAEERELCIYTYLPVFFPAVGTRFALVVCT
jgi:hypothetical protein